MTFRTASRIISKKNVFAKLGKKPSGTQCPAIDGLIKEADETASEIEDKSVLDAAIVANAQATSDQVKSEQTVRGQAEYERVVALATNEVSSIRQRAVDQASARIGEIVFDLVTKVVGREVDQSAHQDLVREAVAALNAESQKSAGR